MKVILLGKEHRAGTSKKTGKPYDNTVAHVSFKRNGVDGQTVDSVWLDSKQYPMDSLKVGAEYYVDRDNYGYVIDFTPVR